MKILNLYAGNVGMESKIIHGDCIEEMKKMEANFVDTIITDPPAGISFMGKSWDSDKGGRDEWIKWFSEVMTECYRVSKPGSTALVWAIPRTSHWTATAMENADWQIKDIIMHIFGSGFPKATDISKQLDKISEKNDIAIRNKIDCGKWIKENREGLSYSINKVAELGNFYGEVNHGGSVSNWEKGNLPTWEHFKKLKGILELDNRFDYLIEDRPKDFIEAEREVIGKGKSGETAIWQDGGMGDFDLTQAQTEEAKKWNGWKSHGLKRAAEHWIVAMKPNEGTYAQNALKWGVSGLNIDGGRIPLQESGEDKRLGGKGDWSSEKMAKNVYEGGYVGERVGSSELGRFPSNIILDEEAAKMLDEQSGELKTGGVMNRTTKRGSDNLNIGGGNTELRLPNQGGASRFFYCAKSSKAERNMGLEGFEEKENMRVNAPRKSEEEKHSNKMGNHHPTVKPLALMEYLCILTKTPTGGIVLDPFAGSCTTAIACIKTKRPYIMIEKEEEYVKIGKARVAATQVPML